MGRKTLNAPEGYMYTDGETYGSQIHLAIGVNSSKFHLISREEYEKITASTDLLMEETH